MEEMATSSSDEVLILEGMGKSTTGEVVSGRRRSARYLGKARPNYALEKKPSVDKKMGVRKKTKLRPSKVLVQSSEPNGSMVPVDASCVCGDEEIKVNGHGGCNEHDNGHAIVDESREAPSDLNQGGHEKRKMNKGGEALVEDESRLIDQLSGVEKSDRQRVKETRRLFNYHYLQSIQEEEKRVREVEAKVSENSKHKNRATNKKDVKRASKLSDLKAVSKNREACEEDVKRASKRPDLKAVSKMQENGTVLYPIKRIGNLPGIEVGDHFYSRAEMVVVGLHSHWLNGIDYMGQSFAKFEEYKNYIFPLAVCIVLSGMYEDDLDNSEDVIYTGQGGHDLNGSRHQIADQKMVQGNLALKNSYLTGAPVRVIRGHQSKSSYCGKVYTYDGLYKVIKQWAEKGQSGYTIFKYKLRRVEGQPVLTTNQVHFTRAQAPQLISELRGLVSEDISGGQENFPIPATNVVNDPPFAPTDFEYSKSIRFSNSLKLSSNAIGCKCQGECVDARICSCAKLNGGDFPYVQKDGGRLIKAKTIVFECGPNCGCNNNCVNRTSQQGLKYRLEVFRTASKGWAVRSWDTIPSGAPVCEYTGLLTRTDEIDTVSENNYIFDIDCLQTMKGLNGREKRPGDETVVSSFDDKISEPEYSIDAGSVGNVARFINHSCEPNLFVQCILSVHHDIKMAKVMLFAADTILPLQELSYDYGYALDSVARENGNIIKLPCYCGAVGCRKRLH